MAKKPQKPAVSRKSPKKALRDSAILSKAAAGKSNSAIAREMGIDRETVARVLSSEDIQRLTQEIDGKLSAGINDAITNVLDAVKKGDKAASIDLLRNFGSMRQSMKFEHTGKDGAPLGSRTDAEIDARIQALLEQMKEGE